ncbi:hypothetical protein ACTXT7_007528 [Hymenolepis weldensis]
MSQGKKTVKETLNPLQLSTPRVGVQIRRFIWTRVTSSALEYRNPGDPLQSTARPLLRTLQNTPKMSHGGAHVQRKG